MFSNLNITSSALSAQRMRMDVVASNIANMDTTRGRYVNGEWQPYQRKTVVLQEKKPSFSSYFQQAKNNSAASGGVRVARIIEDPTPFPQVYNPAHPDADEEGYVAMPNVDPLKEMVDLLSATRSYEANVTVLNASKGMLMKALEIGK